VAGVKVNRNSALGLSTVWACVSLIADSIATLPVEAYTMDEMGVRKSVKPQPRWIERPNPEQTKVDFIFSVIASLLLDGIAPLYTVRDTKGDVVEVWPLDPQWTQLRREKQPNGSWKIVYYFMVAQGQQSPVGPFRVPMGPDMFHINAFVNSVCWPRGVPPLEVARTMFGGAIAGQEMGARFFGQGMNAGGVIENPGDMTIEQAREMKEDFGRANSGLKKMHLPPVLTGGATFKQIMISPEQAQFLEQRNFSVEDICRFYRVPPHMVSHMVRSTSWGSGIEYQGMTFVNYTLRPWIERLEAAWSDWMLLFQQDQKFGLDVSGLLRGDAQSRALRAASGRQWGWLSANDVRADEGKAPIENGDIYLQPVNLIEASADPTAVEAKPPPPDEPEEFK
jgi:HK97 family phage portal protein